MSYTRTTKLREIARVETDEGNIIFYEHDEFRNKIFHETTFLKTDNREFADFGNQCYLYQTEAGFIGAIKRAKKQFNIKSKS